MMEYAPDKTNSLGWYRSQLGRANNRYRTMEFAQPRVLRSGEILSSGWKIYETPRDEASGVSLLFQEGRPERLIPPRLPLQLHGDVPGVLPQDLHVGDILQTGCVVLEPPYPVGQRHPNDQQDIAVGLSGGQRVQTTMTPNDVELAVFGTIDDLGDADDLLTQIVAEKLSQLRQRALHALAEHALFEAMIKHGRPE